MAENAGQDTMFADIFGSDLEASDEEEEEQPQPPPPLPQSTRPPSSSSAVKREIKVEQFQAATGPQDDNEDEDEDDVEGESVGTVLKKKKKRKRVLQRATSFDEDEDEDEVEIGRKKRMRAIKNEDEQVGLIGDENGDVDGKVGDSDANKRRITSEYDDDDGFIDDTGAEVYKEDPDDVIKTEGDFEVDSDIEDREKELQQQQDDANLSYFDQTMKSLKSGTKRKNQNDMNDKYIEDKCMEFIENMMKARDLDITAYNNNKPALNKLKMLGKVEEMLAKVSYRPVLLGNLLLPVMKAWLDPMPDGALPNLNIRKRLLELLDTFPVDQDWVDLLRRSQGLGKVVNFLSIKDNYEPNRRLAKKLMSKWSRPIYQSGSYSRREEYARQRESRALPRAEATAIHVAEEKRQRLGGSNYLARIPERVTFNFRNEPESQVSAAETMEKRVNRRSKKWERAARGIRSSQQRASRPVRTSESSSIL